MAGFYRNNISLGVLLSTPRSGSTMLMCILNSHSQIASPCEICLPYIVYKSKKYRSSIEKLRKICAYYQAPFPKFERLIVWKFLARMHLLELAQAICNHEGKIALIIKDPRHAWYPERVKSMLDSMAPKYILLYRDARGAAYSHYRLGRASLEAAFNTWSEGTAKMLAFQNSLPSSRYIHVKYEDIIADPQNSVKRIVEFLGFDFEPQILNYGCFQHSDDKINLWSGEDMISSVKTGMIDPMIVDRWKSDPQLLLQAYQAHADAQRLNSQLGFN